VEQKVITHVCPENQLKARLATNTPEPQKSSNCSQPSRILRLLSKGGVEYSDIRKAKYKTMQSRFFL